MLNWGANILCIPVYSYIFLLYSFIFLYIPIFPVCPYIFLCIPIYSCVFLYIPIFLYQQIPDIPPRRPDILNFTPICLRSYSELVSHSPAGCLRDAAQPLLQALGWFWWDLQMSKNCRIFYNLFNIKYGKIRCFGIFGLWRPFLIFLWCPGGAGGM